jgi:hypothetical protein
VLLPHAAAHVAYNLRPIGQIGGDERARNLKRRGAACKLRRAAPTSPYRWEFIKAVRLTGSIPYPIRIYFAPREYMLGSWKG